MAAPMHALALVLLGKSPNPALCVAHLSLVRHGLAAVKEVRVTAVGQRHVREDAVAHVAPILHQPHAAYHQALPTNDLSDETQRASTTT
jgi:hypothetical protein